MNRENEATTAPRNPYGAVAIAGFEAACLGIAARFTSRYNSIVSGLRIKLLRGVAVVSAGALLWGCNKAPAGANAGKKSSAGGLVPAGNTGKPLPTYTFAGDDMKRRHPEVAAFVTQFLETCLTGDYVAYRRLVSRFEKPESKERFAAIYRGLQSIIVESIEPLEAGRLAAMMRGAERSQIVDTSTSQPNAATPASPDGDASPERTTIYVVTSTINFDPASKVDLRHHSRKVAILVFQEEGAWRMAPAPAQLQPRERLSRASDSQPAENAEPIPDYPWEQDGDS